MKPALWPLLGATRFYLALMVACAHLRSTDFFFARNPLVSAIDFIGGYPAVLAFLVISGFSIAASHTKSPEGFYGRRLLRVWPLYLLSIVAGCATFYGYGGLAGVNGMPPTSQIIQNMFFLQGWSTCAIMANLPLWSIAIEVACYALTPIFARLSTPSLLLIAMSSEALYFAAPYLTEHPRPPLFMVHGQAVAVLMWVWLLGFIAYRSKRLASAAAKLSCPKWASVAGQRLGDASYPLYLIHSPLYIAIIRLEWHMSSLVALVLAIGLAVLLDRYFDKPINRFFKAKTAQPERRFSPRGPTLVPSPRAVSP